MDLPKLFVINLKRSIDRKKHMEKVCSTLPMDVEFVQAIDVRELTEQDLWNVVDREYCRKNYNGLFEKSAIACFLSHIKTWKLIQKQNLKSAFILEDDIIIKDQEVFIEILKRRNKFPKDWEIVLFAHGNSRINSRGTESSLFNRKKIFNGYELIRFTQIAGGALGYLVNKIGIFRLIKSSDSIYHHVDFQSTGNDKVINLYGIEPVVIEEHSKYGANSDRLKLDNVIKNSGNSKKNNPKKKLIYKKINIKMISIDYFESFLSKLGILKSFKKNIHHPIRRFFRSVILKRYKSSALEKQNELSKTICD